MNDLFLVVGVLAALGILGLLAAVAFHQIRRKEEREKLQEAVNAPNPPEQVQPGPVRQDSVPHEPAAQSPPQQSEPGQGAIASLRVWLTAICVLLAVQLVGGVAYLMYSRHSARVAAAAAADQAAEAMFAEVDSAASDMQAAVTVGVTAVQFSEKLQRFTSEFIKAQQKGADERRLGSYAFALLAYSHAGMAMWGSADPPVIREVYFEADCKLADDYITKARATRKATVKR